MQGKFFRPRHASIVTLHKSYYGLPLISCTVITELLDIHAKIQSQNKVLRFEA